SLRKECSISEMEQTPRLSKGKGGGGSHGRSITGEATGSGESAAPSRRRIGHVNERQPSKRRGFFPFFRSPRMYLNRIAATLLAVLLGAGSLYAQQRNPWQDLLAPQPSFPPQQ